MFELSERAACFPRSDAGDNPVLRGLGCDKFGEFEGKVRRRELGDSDAGVEAVGGGDYALAKCVAGAQIILCRLMGRKVCVKLEMI
jgi:hypothetical protein